MAFTLVFGKCKGGCAASLTSCNLAVYFAHQGYKTAILDCDINQSCKTWVDLRSEELPTVDVIPMLETKKMARTANELKKQYDILIIDGSPALTEQTSYLILLSDLILIPTPADMFSISAQELFVERYLEARSLKGEDIPAYFLMSMYNPRVNLHKEFRDVLKTYEEYDIKTMDSFLEYRTSYRTSLIKGKGAYEWNDPKAKQEIENLGTEVIKIAKTHKLL